MAKKTALYDEHVKLGARMVEFAGWMMPVQYSGVSEEHNAVRNFAGLFDVGHMGTFKVTGGGAAEFLDYLTPADIHSMNDMQAHYSLLLTENGTIVDDIIIYKTSPLDFLIVVNAANAAKDFEWIRSKLTSGAKLLNISEGISLLAIQGPKSASILQKVSDIDLSSISTFRMGIGTVCDSKETLIARTGYTGEDGFEIFANKRDAVKIWRTLLDTGEKDGLVPAGLGARDTLRLEMKYSLYGHEINEETNVIEAGLKWVVKFKKPADFIGKEALLKIMEVGPLKKLVGFKMIDNGIPREGYRITLSGRQIGVVTSGTFSPSLQTPIGIGYVETAMSEIGTKFFVDIRGKYRQAEVVKTPFYKKSGHT